MQSQVSEIDPVTVEIQVEVPWERVQQGINERFAKLQKAAHVKGFRPGKAPRSVLARLFAKDVQAEVVSNLVNESVAEAVKRHELPIVSNAVLDSSPAIADGQPLCFKVKFEVRPKIDRLVTDLALVRRRPTVSDADVDAEIARLRKEHAVLRTLEDDRPVREGDVLAIEYTASIDGVVQPDMSGGANVVLGEDGLLTEIQQALLGARAGERRTVTVDRPASDSNPALAGKKVVFDVTVREVRERILPDLDDEFAKDVGDYGTLLELRLRIRERLQEQAAARAEHELREQAIAKLAELNPIPVPPSLVEQQLRAGFETYARILRILGGGPRLDAEDVQRFRREAENKVRAALLLGELARRASITVSPEEVEAKLAEIAARSGKNIARVRAEHSGERREALEAQLLENKLIDRLLAGATITEAAPEAAGEPTATKE